MTIAAPPSSARPSIFHEKSLRLNRPSTAHTSANVAPPNTQRKNTTLNGLCCDDTTSQPIVPDISIATLISAAPRLTSLVAIFGPPGLITVLKAVYLIRIVEYIAKLSSAV